MKWIQSVAAALADKLRMKFWSWNIDRQMRMAKKRMRLSKVTIDRLNKEHSASCKELECPKCDYGVDAT